MHVLLKCSCPIHAKLVIIIMGCTTEESAGVVPRMRCARYHKESQVYHLCTLPAPCITSRGQLLTLGPRFVVQVCVTRESSLFQYRIQ